MELKVHSLVQGRDWPNIRVIGEYDRDCQVSELEKNDKMFNWQRPTAELIGTELVVKCFPGHDYVYHYALILATYLGMQGRFRDHVCYEVPEPFTCDTAVRRIALDVSMDQAVILGWGMQHLAGADGWTVESGYAWKRTTVDGLSVLYLGFQHSIWGDIAGRVVTRLVGLGARRVVYIGKVGTLDPALLPNTVLATGAESLVGSRCVRWTDFFDGEADRDLDVMSGRHVTSPSTLLETQRWLELHRGYSFVDPEIGPMGEAASEGGIPFGYLHVVSNNLARRYHANLSNERLSEVVLGRARLLDRARDIIGRRLQRIGAVGRSQ